MNETITTTGAELNTTNETGAPTTTAPVKAPPKKKAPPKNERPAPVLKLSARQRTNVDALDNGRNTSASAINYVLACAGRPLTSAEITTMALAFAPERFTRETAHGRVKAHLAHLLRRNCIENVNGAWRPVGAVGACVKQFKSDAPAKLTRALSKAPKGAAKNENETAPEAPASE